jgi:hypothetical protein
MNKATYYPEPNRSVEFDVAKKNDDGSVDLAFEGTLVVTSCEVSETPAIGKCVISMKDVTPAKKDNK